MLKILNVVLLNVVLLKRQTKAQDKNVLTDQIASLIYKGKSLL